MRLINKSLLATAFITLAAVMWVSAQDSRPRFEVASIKPNPPGTPEARGLPVQFMPGGRTVVQKATVNDIVQYAYQLSANWPLEDWQVSGGPNWINSDRYEIEGKADTNARPQQMRLMLQALLENRFKLKTHWETRTLPVYELMAAKNGIRLQKSTDGKCAASSTDDFDANLLPAPPGPGEKSLFPCGQIISGAFDFGAGAEGHLEGTRVAMPMFVGFLTDFLRRTVVDKTGFREIFDLQLAFNPGDEALEGFHSPGEPRLVPTADLAGLSIFTALQEQLGLKLESAKGPVEVLVIDSVSKPAEN